MLENLKKYWFVGLIVLVMVVGTIVFSKEQLNSVFKGKKVDGKDLIYEIAEESKNADDYYAEIIKDHGGSEGYKLFERLVLNSIETSDELKEQAQKDADEHLKYTSAQGTAKVKELETALIQSGYSGIKELNVFYENAGKILQIERDYIDANGGEALESYFETNSPRIVSHILVKMEDPENPTEAEQKLLDEAKAALADGMDFKDAAIKFSDDGSATEGGLIGFLDKNSQFVPEFIKNSISTESGQLSEWFTSQYGQHIVLVGATDYETLKSEDKFIEAVVTYNPEFKFHALWEKAQSLEIDFKDAELEKQIKEYMKIEGVE